MTTEVMIEDIDVSKLVKGRDHFKTYANRYYTSGEVKDLLGVTKQAIHQALLKGVFVTARCYKSNDYYKWFIKKSEIDSLIGTKIKTTGSTDSTKQFIKFSKKSS